MAAGAHGHRACPLAGWWCADCAVNWGYPFGLWVFLGLHFIFLFLCASLVACRVPLAPGQAEAKRHTTNASPDRGRRMLTLGRPIPGIACMCTSCMSDGIVPTLTALARHVLQTACLSSICRRTWLASVACICFLFNVPCVLFWPWRNPVPRVLFFYMMVVFCSGRGVTPCRVCYSFT